MKLTYEILNMAKSDRGGWNTAQVQALGYPTFVRGWLQSSIGKDYPEETINKFVELRNAHIKGENRIIRESAKKRNITAFEPVTTNIKYAEQYRHPNWQKMRLRVLERDGFACVNCGCRHSQLHIHHLKYGRGFIWEVPIWYLVTLCDKCHSEEHGRDLTSGRKLNHA